MHDSTERFLQGLGPDRQELVIAPIADPNAARVLQQIPFTTAWGATYDAISHVAWLGPGRLAFIGEHVSLPRGCSSCVPDTVRVGVGLVIADFAGSALALTRLPDGDSASSLAASVNGDSLYFTKNGDTHVFRRTLSAGQTDTLLDFAAGVVRGIAVSSGTLAAVVGGVVGTPTSPDDGGALFLVTGGGAAMAQIGDPDLLYRRPALSPDGARLVVSARESASTANLWLFQLR